MIRHPAVAGQFYSSNPSRLREEIRTSLSPEENKEKAIGVIAPHAGYVYSGAVAGSLYKSVDIPDSVIILGPNHHGFGAKAAIYPKGEWVSPLGNSKINEKLSDLIKKNSTVIEEDHTAHHYEHSIEVQLPFLQFINKDVTIVPICLSHMIYSDCRELGAAIAKSVKEYGKEVLLIASSDMTHYESARSAKEKDEFALHKVCTLDAEGLLNICREKSISMCGVIPAVVMIVAARSMGATEAKIVKYSTSGDVTGDKEHVVAYAAVKIA